MRVVRFDGFTIQGYQVVGCAQHAACLSGHRLTGTGHLLLGLTSRDTPVVTQLLAGSGVTRASVRREVAARIGPGSGASSACPPLTPRAVDALGYFAAGEGGCGRPWIGPEHLLFALLADPGGTAANALRGVGIDLGAARRRVLPLLARRSEVSA